MWSLEEDGEDVFVTTKNGQLLMGLDGEKLGRLSHVEHGRNQDELWFRFDGLAKGRRLTRTKFTTTGEFSKKFQDCTSNKHFLDILESIGISRISKGAANRKRKVVQKERLAWPVVDDVVASTTQMPEEAEIVAEKLAGCYNIKVTALEVATEEYSLRPVNMQWVDTIKTSIKACPGKAITRIPVLIDPKEVLDIAEFRESHLGSKRLICLGGNHLVTALKQLLQEEKENEAFSVLRNIDVDVYVGLSADECAYIGNWHNRKCHSLATTFQDLVFNAKMVRERHQGSSISWKDMAVLTLGAMNKQEYTKGSLGTVLAVADYSDRNMALTRELFDDFSKKVGPGKSFPQNIFRSLQGVAEEQTFIYLRRAQGTNGSAQASIIKKEKQLKALQQAFIQHMELADWQDAEDTYPEEIERLTDFLDVKMKGKYLPAKFLQFLDAVKLGSDELEEEPITVSINIQRNGHDLCCNTIKAIKEKYLNKIKNELNSKRRKIETDLNEQ